MNRLQCTYSELQAEPMDKLKVFRAFMRGEADAQRAKQKS